MDPSGGSLGREGPWRLWWLDGEIVPGFIEICQILKGTQVFVACTDANDRICRWSEKIFALVGAGSSDCQADIAALSWVIYAPYVEVDLNEFPSLKKWQAVMSERPGVKRGFHVPETLAIKSDDPKAMDTYAKHHSYGS